MKLHRWLIALLPLGLAAVVLAASELTVQVAESRIRREAKFWAPTVQVVHGGERLGVLTRSGDWVEVRTAAGAAGWIHATAVTERDLQLASGDGTVDSATSTDEVTLASKGFSEDVERAYRADRQVAFAEVDRLQGVSVSDGELEGFLRDGKLAEWGRR